jgi:hypothetical protein
MGENSVKLLISAVLMLMLLSLAQAVPENRQLGPFSVSFDLNTNINYQIETPEVKGDSSATPYILILKTDNITGASIGVTEYKNSVDSTIQMQGALAFWKMRARGLNATIPANTAINGKDGFMLSGAPLPDSNAPAGYNVFQAQYWLDSESFGPVSAGTISVDVTSTYTQDITMNLLNSLKVEKTGQAGQGTTSTDMPPAK